MASSDFEDPFDQRMDSSLRRRIHSPGQSSFNNPIMIEDDDRSSSGSSTNTGETRNAMTIWKLLSPRFYLTLIWNSIHSATFASVFVVLLIWASIFIYITFYFIYIPSLDLSRSIHFQFHSDCDPVFRHHPEVNSFLSNQEPRIHGQKFEGKCKLPEAIVQLGQYRSPTLFAKGQQYRIRVDLDLPDSDVNIRQGMFMIQLSLLDANNQVIVSSSRPAIMTHRSLPVKLIHTFFSWPLYITGVKRESEQLEILLIEDYVDGIRSNTGPASSAKVTLVARDVQVYYSTLSIQANLTGLRHYMVNWPILTALFGVATIFAFLSLITICSINRVVRDESADTELIFPDDSVTDGESLSKSEPLDEDERLEDPDSTVNDE